MSRYSSYFIFLVVSTIVISSCGEVDELLPEAPIDINIVSGPEEGLVIDQPSVTFHWTGSNNLVREFSYRLVPHPEYQEWSQWSSSLSTSFERLDEENYTFEIRGRYEPGNETDAPVQRHFSVDIPFALILIVQSDKSIYSLDETAKFTVTLRNMSPVDIRMCFGYSPGYIISVRNEQTGDSTLTEPQRGISNNLYLTLSPGEENVYSSSWNFREFGLYGGDLVPPGKYQITADIIECEAIYFPHVESYPISITIVP